ncbi:MAG: hypothetical protein KDE56_10640 [Anaerolineales bacterium]|nr:hypothetical protein [Anaerolineales bacterium]
MTHTNGQKKTAVVSLTNHTIAHTLETVAELLDAQNANPYRVQAYRNAAATLRQLAPYVGDILQQEGLPGLIRLPHIGRSIAQAIEQLVETSQLPLLERLRGSTMPEQVLATVPTIGPKLASRIYETLDIETLTELQAAAYDGRLDQVPGFGPRRLRAVRESLAGRFRPRPAQTRPTPSPTNQPPVSELLDVDREYRQKARARQLPRITPRRFNPTNEAWLPVLHTERGSNHYTALFSNTARAHELGMIRDWVVIYRDDEDGDGQWTVVTAQFGPLRGQRIVRGREKEMLQHHEREEETLTPT